MAVPPNTTPETATVMTMPYAVNLDVSEADAPEHTVWFTYTAGQYDYQMSFWAYATTDSNYDVRTLVYVGDPETPHLDLNAEHGTPLQMPLTPGETYWFHVFNDGSTEPLNSPLLISTARGQNVATVGWAIAIPDDQAGFPLVIYAQEGGVQQFRPFPAGEAGEVLPSGVSLWHNIVVSGADTLQLYDASLEFALTLDWTFTGNPVITSNRSGTFYIGDRASPSLSRVTTADSTGAMGPTIWTLAETNLVYMGVSHDDAVLYYARSGTAVPILRWDLVNDVALTALAAGVTGYIITGILVLTDTTILVGYYQPPSATDSYVRRYAADGTLLHTYEFGAVKLDHITHHTDDGSFWVWLHLTGVDAGMSRFERLRVSDGLILESFDAPQYDNGVYSGSGTAPDLFGHADSCPFVLVPPLPAYGNGPPPEEHVCVTAPPQAACWNPHDINELQIALLEEGQP